MMTSLRDEKDVRAVLSRLDRPVYAVATPDGTHLTDAPDSGGRTVATVGPLLPGSLGSPGFRAAHGTDYAYQAGGMANGIASIDLVAALARSGFLGTFGAGGLSPHQVETALRHLSAEIPDLPYAVNVLHTPQEEALERAIVESCLRHRVRCVEASAYMDLTPHLVWYRVSGLRRDAQGRPHATNRVIAKASHPDVCRRFLLPPPAALVSDVAARGLVTAEQAELAARVPLADDLTVEADSAGHTDRRPLTSLLPVLARQRDAISRELPYLPRVRLGAAGGIGTPAAVAAAFGLGADYVLTGSVNQSCVEAATAERTRSLLCTAGISDFDMAPSGYMFELGVQVQVLRKGTMFPQRARRLRHLYETYDGLDDLPAADRTWLESRILRRSVGEVWDEVVRFFTARDPDQITRAADDPKRRMALVFRWYLGLSPKWAVAGLADRAADYQIWSGPALGSFNDWAQGTYLADPRRRSAVDVAHHLVTGAAYLIRVWQLRLAGVAVPASVMDYRPVES